MENFKRIADKLYICFVLVNIRDIHVYVKYSHCGPIHLNYWKFSVNIRLNYRFCFLVLGLDEGEQNHNDAATVQGAYLSFLHLRHLRLRDLQRSVSYSN